MPQSLSSLFGKTLTSTAGINTAANIVTPTGSFGDTNILPQNDNKLQVVGNAYVSGNLGIGTTATGKLNVIGNANIVGTVTATAFVGNGSGLTNITTGGIFNVGITSSINYSVTETLDAALTLPSTAGIRYLIHSVHLVNTSSGAVGVTIRLDYSGGTNTFMGNQIPIEAGGALELLKQPLVVNPSDVLRLQGFNDNGDPVSGAIDAWISYQPFSDTNFVGAGYSLTGSQVGFAHTLYTSNTYPTVVQSLRVCNISSTSDYIVSLDWANSIDTRKAYIAYNLTVPQNSAIEILDMPKNVSTGDKIRINVGVSSVVFAQISGKLIT